MVSLKTLWIITFRGPKKYKIKEWNMGKWGILEKSYKNEAKKCYLDHLNRHLNTLLDDFIAKN